MYEIKEAETLQGRTDVAARFVVVAPTGQVVDRPLLTKDEAKRCVNDIEAAEKARASLRGTDHEPPKP